MAKLAILGGSQVLPKGVPVKWPQFDKTDEASLLKVFRSGEWWRGGSVETQAKSVCGRFEREFARYHDSKFGLACGNGTLAVELALRAAGVKPGDEVVVPALSFVVSASAALPLGAVPVFADCDPRTFQPDADSIEAAISPRTTAIVIVHFGGYPADLDRICRVARKHKLPLIEDAAHAHGAQWRGRGIGSWGDFGTFSFQQSKGITSGEGGIVLCKDIEGWRRVYRFHNLGRLEHTGFYKFFEMSSNYRLTDLQGALLVTQFQKFKKQIVQKNAADRYLSGLLRKIGGVEPLPDDKRITRRGYYFYLFRYRSEEFAGLHRDDFLEAMRAEGLTIIGRSYGTPIYKYPLFQNMRVPAKYKGAQYKKTRCPNTERAFGAELVALPHWALLADRRTLAGIAEAVAKVKANAGQLVAAKKCGCLKK